MTKTAFVIAFLVLNGVQLFYGKIDADLDSLAIPEAAQHIVGQFLDAAIQTLSIIAVAVLGLTLPPFKKEP